MDICQWVDCTEPIQQTGRGRPRLYCPEHAAASTAARKKNWIPKMESYDQCCIDWQASGPRRKVCPQHRQWRRFLFDTGRVLYRPEEFVRLLTLFDSDVLSRNFRISTNPDSFEARLKSARK